MSIPLIADMFSAGLIDSKGVGFLVPCRHGVSLAVRGLDVSDHIFAGLLAARVRLLTVDIVKPDTVLPSLLPTADTDSGKSASSESSVAGSWSWSPDTGRAGDTLGDTISRELPTCSSSDRDRGTVSRLGPRLARGRAGISHELTIFLGLGWVVNSKQQVAVEVGE